MVDLKAGWSVVMKVDDWVAWWVEMKAVETADLMVLKTAVV